MTPAGNAAMREAQRRSWLDPDVRARRIAGMIRTKSAWPPVTIPAACRHGHALTHGNIYINSRGYWQCRECGRAAMKRYRESLPMLEPAAIRKAKETEV